MTKESEIFHPVFGANFRQRPDGTPIEQGIGVRTEAEMDAKLQTAELVLNLDPATLKALHLGAAKARQSVNVFATDILTKGLPAQGSA